MCDVELGRFETSSRIEKEVNSYQSTNSGWGYLSVMCVLSIRVGSIVSLCSGVAKMYTQCLPTADEIPAL